MAIGSEHLYDKRLVERHLDRGVVSRDEYEAHIAGLSDCSENVDVVLLGDEGAESEADAG